MGDGLATERLGGGIFVDIESSLDGEIRAVGYVFGEERALATTARARNQLFARLEALARKAAFVGGHNAIWHDLPLLADTGRCPALLRLPVVDSLLLSPLAFPQKPYHRLIKNDKLVTASMSNPLNDAEASRLVAEEALQALGGAYAEDWPFLAAFLCAGNLPDPAKAGIALLTRLLGSEPIDAGEALRRFAARYPDRFCHAGLRRLLGGAAEPEPWTPLAFFAAWVRVAGTDSIVPPWVKRQFPGVYRVMRELRAVPCGDPACAYCAETHDPLRQLAKFFGYSAFMPEPRLRGADGGSLQEEIVRQAIAGRPLLGILPTGGGKSLCFQLPALHRYYRDGALTVVISPLQALMKDQVEGLARKTGLRCMGALYGLLTPPERGELLEELQQGGIGIVYVSPEQLRNPSFRAAIALRDIAYWVCDEAHCISKWGHDFRPDYLYIARFIRELAEETGAGEAAPVLCLTATAKEDVKDEICEHFQQRLGQDLLVLDGGAERANLAYRVEPVDLPHKAARVHEILQERLAPREGAAVVFLSTRAHAEQTAHILKELKWAAEYFHAGLDADEKRGVLERFLAGDVRVICATNAFGMGIDKPDIRLVIHADVPGSLENYLQEAGRAGRDRRPAECILLFNEQDLERQFRLGAFSRIHESDVRKILSALRAAERRSGRDDTVCVSTREILAGCNGGTSMEEDPDDVIDTKVKTAIAVLEEGAFLDRNDNLTRVFQGRPLVADMRQAEPLIERANLPEQTAELWRQFMRVFLELPENAPNAVERFAEVPAMRRIHEIEQANHGRFWNRYRPVFDTLNDMADAGLIKKDLLVSAIVHVGAAGSSDLRRRWWVRLERRMLECLRERDPDPDPDEPVPLNMKRLNTALARELGEPTLLEAIPKVLELWRRDRPRMDGGASAFVFRKAPGGYRVELPDGWDPIVQSAELRHNAGALVLAHILAKARAAQAKGRIEVEFAESDLLGALRGDLQFAEHTSRSLARIVRFVLVSLHDQGVLTLNNGKALFTQSMHIRLRKDPDGKYTRRFGKAHFDRLEIYYQERNFQIHVMGEYARLGMDSLTAHLRLIRDYFRLGNAAFARKYFAGRDKELRLATGMESYRRIVDQLGNKEQEEIVAAPEAGNRLVLAGPGSGKTRVVAHRCAYLLRVRRVRPRSILVVCFNRHACLTLRQRIHRLVGDDARGVTIQTYHGLALTLLGRTIAGDGPRTPPEAVDFDALITEATEVLRAPAPDAEEAEDTLRGRLLRGYRHILVDEYQDISQREYAFLSQIAGRTLNDPDQKLSILAVGDDDQNIYAFRDTSTEFIRRFKQDYQAEIHYLVQNYRSTAHIIQAANQLIRLNRDRMKSGHEIRVDARRRSDPPGGAFARLDGFRKGRVQVIQTGEPAYECALVLEEIRALRRLDPDAGWNQFAVISRKKAELHPVRALLEAEGIPVDWRAETDALPSPFRVREIHDWLERLRAADTALWDAAELGRRLEQHRADHCDSPWCGILTDIAAEWEDSAGDGPFPVRLLRDFFLEALAEYKEQRRGTAGVVLLNAHKAKGLEFPHVFILSGGWNPAGPPDRIEEERRLYYVAMTRAEATLTLCQGPRLGKWLQGLQGKGVLRRQWAPAEGQRQRADTVAGLRYEVIGLDHLFISYAGLRAPGARIHACLAKLRTGDPLTMAAHGPHILLQSPHGVVGSLSAEGCRVWRNRLDRVEAARVMAVLCRYREDGETLPNLPVRSDSWEIPLAEVAWREGAEEAALVAAEAAAPYTVPGRIPARGILRLP